MASSIRRWKIIDALIREIQETSSFQFTQIIAQDTPSASTIPSIPSIEEISRKIFSYLDVEDLKSLHLAGHPPWNATAYRCLLKTFVIRADRDVIKDLELTPNMLKEETLKAIRGFRFELGTLSINYALENLGFAYFEKQHDVRPISVAEISYEELVHMMEGMTEAGLDSKKKEAMEEYAAWNTRWHNSKQDFTRPKTLQGLFEDSNIDHIEMAYKACPFKCELLMNAWIQETHNSTFSRKIQEFSAVSTALKTAGSSLKHFSHDNLPWVLFTQDSVSLGELFKPFKKLESIRLTLQATQTPTAKFWSNLGSALKSMPKLKEVRIGFAPFQSGFIDHGTWQDSDNAAEWYVPLQHMFSNHTWHSLQTLRLDGMVVCEAGLASLLERHPTLRSLELHNIALWQGSFQSLFTKFAELPLVEVRMWGVFTAFQAREESWRFDTGDDIDLQSWSKVFKEFLRQRAADDMKIWSVENNLSVDSVRSGLEAYATQKPKFYGLGPWLLSPEHGILKRNAPHLGHRSTHNQYCSPVPHSSWSGCASLQPTALQNRWEQLIVMPNPTTGDFDTPDLPGVGEPEFATFYNPQLHPNTQMPALRGNHVDIYGFDANGMIGSKHLLDGRGYATKRGTGRASRHYSKLQNSIAGIRTRDHVSIDAVTAYRGMLDGVLGLISRYREQSRLTGVAMDLLGTAQSDRQTRSRELVLGRVVYRR